MSNNYLKKLLFCLLHPTWTNFSEKIFQMIILAVLSEQTGQCPKTQFLCLLYVYTFPIASFLFVQWTDLGFKNPLQLAHSIFGHNFMGAADSGVVLLELDVQWD